MDVQAILEVRVRMDRTDKHHHSAVTVFLEELKAIKVMEIQAIQAILVVLEMVALEVMLEVAVVEEDGTMTLV
tara:strand:- start:264 stop:482 length:219 start_codon:yes stop_codon:yes gene_type:complete